MTNRFHSSFKPSLIEGSEYLKKYISKNKDDDTKIDCLACQGFYRKPISLYFENLQVHIDSQGHAKTVKTSDEKKKLKEAAEYLIGKKTSIKQFPKLKNDQKDEDPNEDVPTAPIRKKVTSE